MSTEKQSDIVLFLRRLLRSRRRIPCQLASDLGVSHSSVSRWLSAKDAPSVESCHKLAEYSGVPLEKILSFAGYLPRLIGGARTKWPDFREYVHHKYPMELDEDIITMIEVLIQRRRERKHSDVGNDS